MQILYTKRWQHLYPQTGNFSLPSRLFLQDGVLKMTVTESHGWLDNVCCYYMFLLVPNTELQVSRIAQTFQCYFWLFADPIPYANIVMMFSYSVDVCLGGINGSACLVRLNQFIFFLYIYHLLAEPKAGFHNSMYECVSLSNKVTTFAKKLSPH